jgi:hypothetical protein
MQYKPGGWAGKQEAGRQSSHSVTSRRRKIYFQLYRERGRDREKEREREREREKKRRERERGRETVGEEKAGRQTVGSYQFRSAHMGKVDVLTRVFSCV